MDDNLDAGVDWSKATNMREMSRPATKEAKVDEAVTKVLGKRVLVNDPRLIRLVVEWKKKTASDPDSDRMDNFLQNVDFLIELRKTFA